MRTFFVPCHMCMKCPWKWFRGNGQRQRNRSLLLTDNPLYQRKTEKKLHTVTYIDTFRSIWSFCSFVGQSGASLRVITLFLGCNARCGKIRNVNWSSSPWNGSMFWARPVGISNPVVVHRCGVQSSCIDLENKHTFMWHVSAGVVIYLFKLKCWRETPELTHELHFSRAHLFCGFEDDVLYWRHPRSPESGVGWGVEDE